mgnify:FL=1
MRLSKNFTRTIKQTPADEVSRNAQLLIRAGYVYKTMAGVYSYTPLGLRVLEKIKQIVREEMNAIDSQELIMSSLQRKELWQETGRWSDDLVDVWFKSKLQDDTEVGFGWTHEEPIVEMLRSYLKSYKDLPMSVYQFQNKFRNELRAKSGIMRGREFVMKDMYSVHASKEDLDKYYEQVIEAYKRCYQRLGLGEDTYVTFASGGAFTKFSHEFQTLCQAGEDDIYIVPSTNVAYNAEVAPVKASPNPEANAEMKPLEILDDKSIIGAEALVEALNIPLTSSTKSMLYDSSAGLLLAVVRSDYEINEDKLKAEAYVSWLRLADAEQTLAATGAEIGFAGLYNLPDDVQLIVDDSCQDMVNFETGANKTGQHAYNVNWQRDVPLPAKFVDIKMVKPGDISPETDEIYVHQRTAEVGNIFNFGTQKSQEMNLTFTDASGAEQYAYMGSYGIGITRVMGVIVEKLADDKGLVWPENIAPARVYLVQIGSESKAAADELYDALINAGIEVIYDDRDERPGVKFADAELMGIPTRVTVSDRLLKDKRWEVTARTTGEQKLLTTDELLATLD